MRNLIQYPITYDELLIELGRAADRYDPEVDGVGGIEGTCLDMIQIYLTHNEQHVRQFLATMQETVPQQELSNP
jgi:hypothetical protein